MAPHPFMMRLHTCSEAALKRDQARFFAATDADREGWEPQRGWTAAERWAMAVLQRATRSAGMGGVIDALALAAKLIRRATASPIDATFGLNEVVNHHLVVHRTLMVTVMDAALRLVATVWNLGVPERAVNIRVIRRDVRMAGNPAIGDALDAIWELVEPYGPERQMLVHEGIFPDIPDMDWSEIYRNEGRMSWDAFNENAVRIYGRNFSAIASEIEDEVSALRTAQNQLFTALLPDLEQQLQILEGEQAPPLAQS